MCLHPSNSQEFSTEPLSSQCSQSIFLKRTTKFMKYLWNPICCFQQKAHHHLLSRPEKVLIGQRSRRIVKQLTHDSFLKMFCTFPNLIKWDMSSDVIASLAATPHREIIFLNFTQLQEKRRFLGWLCPGPLRNSVFFILDIYNPITIRVTVKADPRMIA